MREVRRNGSFHRYLMLKMAEQIHHSASTSISLIGFMGAGKTTVGRLLAERLGWRFLDLDELIEQAEGRSIAEIFQRDGETHFRKLESTHLQDILLKNSTRTVIATGGGTPCFGENMEWLTQHSRCIYLHVALDVLENRLMHDDQNRPLSKGNLHTLLQQRSPDYERALISISGNPATNVVVEHILSVIPSTT
jgi:shikimate kinase